MNRRLIVLVLAIGVALTIGILHTKSAAAGDSTASQAVASAPSIAQMQETALHIAAESGDADPSGIEEAKSTLGTVSHVIEPQGTGPTITDPETGKPWSESPVYVVTMRGHFTYDGPAPRGGSIPTGTSLTVTINPQTGALVSESLSESAPNMQAISSSASSLGG
jgi:hypothetical protein